MKTLKLPPAETYERELKFMPYRESINQVRDLVCANIPINGGVLDLMCGTGYLLGQIKKREGDFYGCGLPSRNLRFFGVDLNKNYINYARKKYSGVDFFVEDVLKWEAGQFDSVLCTGALHHIPYEKQEEVVANIAEITKPEGFVIISDCYIGDYTDETERQLAAAELGYEYLKATINNGAPLDVIKATADIITNDVSGEEFKTSIKKRLPIFKKYFKVAETKKTWPDRKIGGYGDYIHLLRK